MTWNYRIVHASDALGESWGIHEVYYDTKGRPESYTADAVGVVSDEGPSGITETLTLMTRALALPVLEAQDFPRGALAL